MTLLTVILPSQRAPHRLTTNLSPQFMSGRRQRCTMTAAAVSCISLRNVRAVLSAASASLTSSGGGP